MTTEETRPHPDRADQEPTVAETGESLPDFKQLEDRVIAPAPTGPFLRIRTNLDGETPGEEK